MKIKEMIGSHDKEKERCRKEVESIKRDIDALEMSIKKNQERLAERIKLYEKYLEMDVDKWIKKYPDKTKINKE